MPSARARDAEWAFSAYEAVRHRMPRAEFGAGYQTANTLADLADRFDVFLLDAFGVLNVGITAIPGVAQRIDDLRAASKTVMVLSNAASYPKRLLLDRYAQLGFDFAPQNVLCSREVLLAHMHSLPRQKYGLMAPDIYGTEELEALDVVFLADDPADYSRVDAFAFLGSGDWNEHHQSLLQAALLTNPRPLLVGNPDIVAPREDGLSREPGHYAHRIADATGIVPEFFGKPFGNVFNAALARLDPGLDRSRVVMVGDTLQTDVLGGRAAGLGSALITGHGALAAIDAADAIARSGITPDFVLPDP
jgi:HAD superfamily hydrolase (TIGR01459 family)